MRQPIQIVFLMWSAFGAWFLSTTPIATLSSIGAEAPNLADVSQAIIIARVLDVVAGADSERSETDYLVEVETVIRGKMPHRQATVRVHRDEIIFGTDWGNDGVLRLCQGDQALLFLVADEHDANVFNILSGHPGAFHIQPAVGAERVFRED